MPCKIYETRPEFCKIYPYEKRLDSNSNVYAPRFKECQYNAESGWVTYEELLQMKSVDEISNYCNKCNLCCWLPDGTTFDFGTRNADIDWSKVYVDADYWKETVNLCEHCELPDGGGDKETESQVKLIQLEPMGISG